MDKEVQLLDIETNGFLHSDIDEFIFDQNKKKFILKLDGADLKIGGIFYNCTITITDWWDFEVTEKGTGVNVTYKPEEIPKDIEQIFEYRYDGTTLIFEAIGYLSRDSVVYYKFTKPKIHITGQYDPD